jgi:hypothetical protein
VHNDHDRVPAGIDELSTSVPVDAPWTADHAEEGDGQTATEVVTALR